MQDLKITLVQADLVWEDIPANLERFDERLQSINEQTDLIILPEMFNTGFTTEPARVAESPDGGTLRWMQEKAAKKQAIVTGSILVRIGDVYFNRLHWVQPGGEYFSYDKRHLFSMGNEHLKISAGKTRTLVSWKSWNILPLICYDLRFPVWSRNQYLDNNYEYDLLFYIANWPDSRSHAFRSLLVARAIENQAYVAGVNRIGTDGLGMVYSGGSMVVDPRGKVAAELPPGEEGSISFVLEKAVLEDFRGKFRVGPDWDGFKIIERP
jgi:predicted amidohydrolase